MAHQFRKRGGLMTVREILLERLKTYAAEVESGSHVPPPPRMMGRPVG